MLVIAATMLSVTFATRGAMATNKTVIEVLHFVGAKNGFIAGNFQRHFLILGLEGGAIGGGAAIALFALAVLRQPLVRRLGRRRADRGAVRLVLDRPCGLCGRLMQVVLIARRDRGDLAADGQPHAGVHRLACSPARPLDRFSHHDGRGRGRAVSPSAFSGSPGPSRRGVTLAPKADGIVVLTGGPPAIPEAVELLAAERGKRLLITGVHRATGRARSPG